MKAKAKMVITLLKLKAQELAKSNKIITVILLAVLAVWGLSVFIFSTQDIGTATAAQELEQLNANIRRHYQNRPDYWGLNTTAVKDKSIAPQSMLKPEGLRNFFATEVLVGNGVEGQMLMPGARNFDIVYKNLSKQQCRELASFKFSEQFWMGVSAITIGDNSNQQTFSWNDTSNQLPISNEATKKCCHTNNTIIWHFE